MIPMAFDVYGVTVPSVERYIEPVFVEPERVKPVAQPYYAKAF
jgi:hypothetical protein